MLRNLKTKADKQLERSPIKKIIKTLWTPHPENTPQIAAFNSEADITGFGGRPGGGKSDLLCGLAVEKHQKSIIFRREFTQIKTIQRRLSSILKGDAKWNGQEKVFKLKDGRYIDLGSLQHQDKDKDDYQGQDHDLIGFDEATHFREDVIRFLSIWNRSTDKNQQCRIVLTFNPPTNVEGRWVIKFFAPWIDKNYPGKRAVDGEIRWFAMIDGKEVEVESGDRFMHGDEEIKPASRTFIFSGLENNPYLKETNYKSVLQALPEPLRSIMLLGDFDASIQDDQWQIIPTQWIYDAIERGKKQGVPVVPLSAIGCDPARGGRDTTVLCKRYGDWIAPLIISPGKGTPDGSSVAAIAVSHLEGNAYINVDVIGIGSSPYDCLIQMDVEAYAINGAIASKKTDRTGKLGISNLRSEMYWMLREMLDPAYNPTLCLPDDPQLVEELAAHRWGLRGYKIAVADKDKVKELIGRSPDRSDALCYALLPPGLSGLVYKESFSTDGDEEDYGWG